MNYRPSAVIAIGLALALFTRTALADGTNAPTSADVEKRIDHVINGLLPATVFRTLIASLRPLVFQIEWPTTKLLESALRS